MKDDRLKIQVDPAYASALGLAVYAFAALEWNAVRCCERIEPGSIDTLNNRTAGRVADTLRHLAGQLPPSPTRDRLDSTAADFQALVRSRNNLLHAKPGTNAHGEHRLFRDGDQWTQDELAAVADAFTSCSMRLGECLEVRDW